MLYWGIRFSHVDVGGRALFGFDYYGKDGTGDACSNGHGTHVAGIVGGGKYGVAKGVRLVSVRVLDCDGSGSDAAVIAGINWVTGNHDPSRFSAVANMSEWTTGPDAALDDAISESISAGVTYTVIAGNDGTDNVCGHAIADVGAAITVGASDSTDTRWGLSTYGPCVDIYAPGVRILSDWNASDTSTYVDDGTSMAAPFVAGVAALYLQQHPNAAPASVAAEIEGLATNGVIVDAGANTVNRLLYSRMQSTKIWGPDSVEVNTVGVFNGSAFGGVFPHVHRWYLDDVLSATDTVVDADHVSEYYVEDSVTTSHTLRLDDTDARGETLSETKTVGIYPVPTDCKRGCPIFPSP